MQDLKPKNVNPKVPQGEVKSMRDTPPGLSELLGLITENHVQALSGTSPENSARALSGKCAVVLQLPML